MKTKDRSLSVVTLVGWGSDPTMTTVRIKNGLREFMKSLFHQIKPVEYPTGVYRAREHVFATYQKPLGIIALAEVELRAFNIMQNLFEPLRFTAAGFLDFLFLAYPYRTTERHPTLATTWRGEFV